MAHPTTTASRNSNYQTSNSADLLIHPVELPTAITPAEGTLGAAARGLAAVFDIMVATTFKSTNRFVLEQPSRSSLLVATTSRCCYFECW